MSDPLETRLKAFTLPPMPPDLRAEVLGPARRALMEDASSDPWFRLWRHRGLRLAWAAAAALLVAANLTLAPRPRRTEERNPFTVVNGVRSLDPELQPLVDLPSLKLDTVSTRPSRPVAGRQESLS